MAETVYLRNNRPNAVLVRWNGMKFAWERRGSREDNLPVPADLLDDMTVQRFLREGILEQISKEAFFDLGQRTGEKPNIPLKQHTALEVNIPFQPVDHREPFIITDKTIAETKPMRSPNPQFEGRVKPTDVELGYVPDPEAGLDRTEADRLRDELAELRAELSRVKEEQTHVAEEVAEATPKARKAPATRTKSVKKTTRKSRS
jgi:hypothetical protein